MSNNNANNNNERNVNETSTGDQTAASVHGNGNNIPSTVSMTFLSQASMGAAGADCGGQNGN